jgi:hypothetical protein
MFKKISQLFLLTLVFGSLLNNPISTLACQGTEGYRCGTATDTNMEYTAVTKKTYNHTAKTWTDVASTAVQYQPSTTYRTASCETLFEGVYLKDEYCSNVLRQKRYAENDKLYVAVYYFEIPTDVYSAPFLKDYFTTNSLMAVNYISYPDDYKPSKIYLTAILFTYQDKTTKQFIPWSFLGKDYRTLSNDNVVACNDAAACGNIYWITYFDPQTPPTSSSSSSKNVNGFTPTPPAEPKL